VTIMCLSKHVRVPGVQLCNMSGARLAILRFDENDFTGKRLTRVAQNRRPLLACDTVLQVAKSQVRHRRENQGLRSGRIGEPGWRYCRRGKARAAGGSCSPRRVSEPGYSTPDRLGTRFPQG